MRQSCLKYHKKAHLFILKMLISGDEQTAAIILITVAMGFYSNMVAVIYGKSAGSILLFLAIMYIIGGIVAMLLLKIKYKKIKECINLLLEDLD